MSHKKCWRMDYNRFQPWRASKNFFSFSFSVVFFCHKHPFLLRHSWFRWREKTLFSIDLPQKKKFINISMMIARFSSILKMSKLNKLNYFTPLSSIQIVCSITIIFSVVCVCACSSFCVCASLRPLYSTWRSYLFLCQVIMQKKKRRKREAKTLFCTWQPKIFMENTNEIVE